jgi:hypothetical protein
MVALNAGWDLEILPLAGTADIKARTSSIWIGPLRCSSLYSAGPKYPPGQIVRPIFWSTAASA